MKTEEKKIRPSQRSFASKEYYFSSKLREIELLKREGRSIINLAIGNPDLPPYNQVYFGRGYVQLTWERNYVLATRKLRERGVVSRDVDLARNPDLAMARASDILVANPQMP